MIQRDHKFYISKCIEFAKLATGHVSPNPLVGCVIVNNNKILATGWHKKYGGSHAEVNAINNYFREYKTDFFSKDITLYSSLEPCCHTNKQTPPCVNLIINSGIKNVVIGCLDPNPNVAGKSVKVLKENGIKVTYGILNKECEELNQIFFKNIIEKIPYIHLKMALTINGKIAQKNGDSKWITNEKSRIEVHKLRLKYDAIAVGINTVLEDNPMLNIRMGIESNGKIPYKIIFGFNERIFDYELLKDNIEKLIIISSKINQNSISKLKKNKVKFIITDNLKDALKQIKEFKITSILVEGGARLFSSFLSENLYDKISIFTAPTFFPSGINVCSDNNNFNLCIKIKNPKISIIDDNFLTEGVNNVYRSC